MGHVVILGVFVADTAYRAERQPRMGETILGDGFALGPGGKGSNQAVAAAPCGGRDALHHPSRPRSLRRHGADDLEGRGRHPGDHPARRQLHRRGLHLHRGRRPATTPSSSAPASPATISEADIEARRRSSRARRSSSPSLNSRFPRRCARWRSRAGQGCAPSSTPRPAAPLAGRDAGAVRLRHPERDRGRGADRPGRDDGRGSEKAAAIAARHGRRGRGHHAWRQGCALSRRRRAAVHVPPFSAGPVVETTGAGDAFNGGFAAALARDMDPVAAVLFG